MEEIFDLYKETLGKCQKPKGVEILFDVPLSFRSIDDIKNKTIDKCEIKNILGILANGDYSICGIGETYPELRMGNILENSVGDVWEKNPILCDMRRSLPAKLEGICHNCIFAEPASGPLISEVYLPHRAGARA